MTRGGLSLARRRVRVDGLVLGYGRFRRGHAPAHGAFGHGRATGGIEALLYDEAGRPSESTLPVEPSEGGARED